jgi:hypothetical protein
MDENDVIECIRKHLEEGAWKIEQAIRAGEPGIDVIARSSVGHRFLIEAKGGTSSRPGSNRHGKPYTKTQVFDVCSKGLMQCLHHVARKKPDELIGFAYPRGRYFSDYMDPIADLIHGIGIVLFIVESDGRVTERSSNHCVERTGGSLHARSDS